MSCDMLLAGFMRSTSWLLCLALAPAAMNLNLSEDQLEAQALCGQRQSGRDRSS